MFNGVTYSTAAGQTYHNVTSRNCGEEELPPRLDVFARGTSNQLIHTWYVADGNGLAGFEDLGGTLTSDPAVAAQ